MDDAVDLICQTRFPDVLPGADLSSRLVGGVYERTVRTAAEAADAAARPRTVSHICATIRCDIHSRGWRFPKREVR